MVARSIRAVALILLSLLPGAARSQPANPAPPLRIGIYLGAPFATELNGRYSGMAIELWEHIAANLGRSSAYQPAGSISDLLDMVQAGKVDIAVAALTITHERLENMAFTQPWFDTGLRVMVNKDKRGGFLEFLHALQTSGHLRVYAWLGVLILVATVGLTLVDRRFDPEFPREWHNGLAESFYYVISVATSGKAQHKLLFGAFGRLLAAIWLVCGIAVVAYITSSITSIMMVRNLTMEVNSAADLPGKIVGVLAGSTGEAWARDAALNTRSYDTIAEAVGGIMRDQVAAIVSDAPTLEFYDKSHPELPITEVGAIFNPAKFGFALPRHSTLTRAVSLQLLAAEEDGYLEKLRAKYFGITP